MHAPSRENDVTLTCAAEPQELPVKMAANTGPVVTAPVDPLAGASGFSPAARAGTEASTFPAGFPPELKEKMAWTGTNFPDPSQYAHVVTEKETAEIKAAVQYFKGK